MSMPPSLKRQNRIPHGIRFFSSQQNGELLPVSFKRSELVDEAETDLGTARLAVESIRLFLSVASETVDVGALAEGIG